MSQRNLKKYQQYAFKVWIKTLHELGIFDEDENTVDMVPSKGTEKYKVLIQAYRENLDPEYKRHKKRSKALSNRKQRALRQAEIEIMKDIRAKRLPSNILQDETRFPQILQSKYQEIIQRKSTRRPPSIPPIPPSHRRGRRRQPSISSSIGTEASFPFGAPTPTATTSVRSPTFEATVSSIESPVPSIPVGPLRPGPRPGVPLAQQQSPQRQRQQVKPIPHFQVPVKEAVSITPTPGFPSFPPPVPPPSIFSRTPFGAPSVLFPPTSRVKVTGALPPGMPISKHPVAKAFSEELKRPHKQQKITIIQRPEAEKEEAKKEEEEEKEQEQVTMVPDYIYEEQIDPELIQQQEEITYENILVSEPLGATAKNKRTMYLRLIGKLARNMYNYARTALKDKGDSKLRGMRKEILETYKSIGVYGDLALTGDKWRDFKQVFLGNIHAFKKIYYINENLVKYFEKNGDEELVVPLSA